MQMDYGISNSHIHLMSLKQENVCRILPTGLGQVIHRLPVEILTQIFLFCLPVNKKLGLSTSLSRKEAPLSLCHVCSSWRWIALRTLDLWTFLAMKVSVEDSLVVSERHSQAASHWFSHAGCRLIDLKLSSRIFDDPDEIFSANFMIQVVRPRAERIRSLDLSFWNVSDICCFLDDGDTTPHHPWSFPNLEYLTLHLYTDWVEEFELTTFSSMPKLHTVVLSGTFHSNEPTISLPWAQLTSLAIQTIPESLFRIVISQCPALETGDFSIVGGDSDEELPIVDLSLTRLTTFSIHFCHGSDPSLFTGIRFPALDVFTSYGLSGFNWTPPGHIFRQLAPITTLSLGGHIYCLDMIDMLCETKNVTTFEVEFAQGHGEVLRALTLGEEHEVLLPKLSVLHVRLCSGYLYEPFAMVNFVQMVASRSPGGPAPFGVAPLQEVWVEEPIGPVNTLNLKTEMDAVIEHWSHKTDMPQVRYEKREW